METAATLELSESERRESFVTAVKPRLEALAVTDKPASYTQRNVEVEAVTSTSATPPSPSGSAASASSAPLPATANTDASKPAAPSIVVSPAPAAAAAAAAPLGTLDQVGARHATAAGSQVSAASTNSRQDLLVQARLDPTRSSATDPQRALYPNDVRRLTKTGKGIKRESDMNIELQAISETAEVARASTTSALAEIVSDPHHPEFDLQDYWIHFVERFFPGRMLGAFIEFRDLGFSAQVRAPVGGAAAAAAAMEAGDNHRHVPHASTLATAVLEMLHLRKRPTTQKLQVLQGVNGFVEPGDLTLIIGGPSSGKSTLLKALAGRLNSGTISGSVLVNGELVTDTENYNRICGYIPQNDVHIPTLTVGETLKFAAELQLPEDMPAEDKLIHVRAILKLLGLEHTENTLVGNPLIRGVSGGEKKRVTIAVEMLKTPNVLLLDEPTTGLDSAAAYKVLSHVRKIADVGFPAMAALLQPSKELFELFNRVLVISNGRVVYFGDRQEVLPYFASLGFVCPPEMNPADFLAQVTDHPEKFVAPETSSKYTTDFFIDSFIKSEVNAALGRKLWKGVSPRSAPRAAEADDFPKYPSRFARQFVLNFARSWRINLRDPTSLNVRIFRGFLMGFITATLFMNLGDNQNDAATKLGTLVSICAFFGLGAAARIPLYLGEREVYLVQRKAKYFQPLAYLIAVTLAEMPFVLLEVIPFTFIVYWSVGLRNTAGAFFYLFFLCVGMGLWGNSYCRAATTIAPSFAIANAIVPSSTAILFLFCGYMLPATSFPVGWKWMYHLSPLTYAYSGLALNEFNDVALRCDPNELVPHPGDPRLALPFDQGGFNNTRVCPYNTGNEYISVYGIPQESSWLAWNMLIIYFYYLFFVAVSYICLKVIRFDAAFNPHVDDEASRNARRTLIVKKAIERLQSSASGIALKPVQAETAAGSAQQPAYLEFKNLSYSVQTDKGEKPLLTNVNGYVKPGTLVALMGPSGAGKTTLLDVLADRKTGGVVTGEILINNAPRNEFFKRMSGYCEQQDVHLARTTVREAIAFSAMCRLPQEMSHAEKMRRVESVIYELDLEEIGNDLVGSLATGGLSPEQRKRLTIAVELVTDPPLLFLDEPTSGLDAYGAALVMNKIAEIARSGKSVICTIHQPSAEIFSKFDHLLLLKAGGRQVFFGPVGENHSNLLGYIKKHFGLTFNHDRNPADWVLDTVCAQKDFDGPALWDASPESAQVLQTLRTGVTPPGVTAPHFDRPGYSTTYSTQMNQVWRRTFTSLWRNTSLVLVRFAVCLVVGLILGTMYWQQDSSQLAASNRIAVIFFSVVFISFSSKSAIGEVMDIRPVFFREKASGTYHPGTLALSMVLVELPFIAVYCFTFAIPMYFIAGLRSGADHFFFFMLVFYVTGLTANAFMSTVAVFSPNAAVANALAPLILTFGFLFSGFFITYENIPQGWIWMYYISYFAYPLLSLSVNELQGVPFNCNNLQGAIVVHNPYNVSESTVFCPISNGDDVLARFGIDPDNRWPYFGGICGFYLGFTILFMLGMRYYSSLKR
ncbi:ABC transporter [Capsaspora owczarzaki ATCC 30864]|uniref:ABC transporter n=1 Tax=Capsaspora owczarzaki (strain ATCC 30864) TaxID=595528 RepID=A0A0D2WJU5_CAPO3|nr:ABC transporter [Capsaspora owczarzaki ATCC 30864]KJE89713.1 ABC transporter [Capsaspora owczarzaki ATCC 30864]|eukprot:XP_004366015.1 ABC transporter [Capsaspora owczarzaki ATCC 30864]